MRIEKRLLALAVVVLMIGGIARGQVLKQVPADSFMVFKVSKLGDVSKKVADLAGKLGLAEMQPDFADPLGALEKNAGITAGVNKAGDLAIAMGDPSAGAEPTMLALIPVTDYKAFLGNWPDAKTEGEISTISIKGEAWYLTNWGEYAAMSQAKDLLGKKPTGFVVSGAGAKEMDGKDFVAHFNMKLVRAKLLSGIDDGRKNAGTELDNMLQMAAAGRGGQADMTKISPLLKVLVNQAMNLAQQFVTDTNSVTFSSNIGAEGINMAEIVDFQTGSPFATQVNKFKNTDASLLTGLPDGKYIFFGGSKMDPKVSAELASTLIDPIVTDTAGLEQGPAIANLAAILKTMMGATSGGSSGMVAPAGQLGVDPLIQVIGIYHGDAAVLSDSTRKLNDATQALVKSMGLDANMSPPVEFTEAAKTIDGVKFDEYKTVMPQNAQAQQAQMILNFMFGQGGITRYRGTVNDSTILDIFGISDAAASVAIKTIKANDDPLAKTAAVKGVAAQLPAQRVTAIYIPLSELAASILNYAKPFAMDMGVKMAEDLPPIGITVASDTDAIRIDGYIPSQLVEALTSAGMQVYMQMNQRNGGAAQPNGL